MNIQNELRLLTRAEAAKALSIGKHSLNGLIKAGSIPVLMINNQIYIPYLELVKFIKENTVTLHSDENYRESEIDFDRIREKHTETEFNSTDLFNKMRGIQNGKHI